MNNCTNYLKRYFLLSVCGLILGFGQLHAQFKTNGNAYSTGQGCFVLTNAQAFEAGSVWYLNKVNLNQPFDLYFQINLGCKDADGADGMAFVLQQVSTSVGSSGAGLGYSGIQPSLTVEFDTWQNGDLNDPTFDHMSMMRNGNVNHNNVNNLAGPTSILPGNANIEDCNFHLIRITWEPANNTYSVYVDCQLRMSYTGNIRSNIFNNDPLVFWGFTGATGGYNNVQKFCLDYVSFTQASIDTAICENGSVQIDVGSGQTFSWTPTTGVSNPNIRNPILSPDTTTQYIVNVIDSCGYVRENIVNVEVKPNPVAVASNDTALCQGQSAQLFANGGATYQWSPPTGLSNPNVANPVVILQNTTTYTVTVTAANGCIDTEQVRVSNVQADAGPDRTICQLDSVQLLAAGGSFYQWSPAIGLSNPNVINPKASPLVSTTYTVTITYPTGCTDTDTMRVNVRSLPLANAGADISICKGDTGTLAGNPGITSYLWTPAATLSSPNSRITSVFPTQSSTYTLTVTDGFGCKKSDQVGVTVWELPVLQTARDTATCEGISVPVQAISDPGFQYAWTPAQWFNDPALAMPQVTPDSSQWLTITLTDTNGCISVDSQFVRVMHANAGEDFPICIYDSTRLMASGGVAYVWDPSPDLIFGNQADPVVFPQITTSFFVTVTDTIGCTNRDTVTVIVNPLPVTGIASSEPYVCSNGTTQLTGTGGINYLWSPGGTFSDSTIFNPIATLYNLTPNLIDSTWLFVAVTDTNGCTNYDSIGIEVRLRPIITVSADTFVCPGGSVPLAATGGVTCLWTPGLTLSDSTTFNTIATPLRSTYYTATVTAVWGCTEWDSVLVYVIAPEAGRDSTICRLDSAKLLGGGGVNYLWSPPTGLSSAFVAQPFASPDSTTSYTVIVTDSLGCVDSDFVTVFVNQLPPAYAGPDTSMCFGDSVGLSASGGIAYLWTPGTGLSVDSISNPIAFPDQTVTYTVAVTDTNQCTQYDSLVFTVHPLPLVDAGADTAICRGDTATLVGKNAVVYLWSPPETLSANDARIVGAFPDQTSMYMLLGIDQFGCMQSDSMWVRVKDVPTVTGDLIDSVCVFRPGLLEATGAVASGWPSLFWSTGDTTNVITPTPRRTTDYWVVAMTDGCTSDTLKGYIFVAEDLPLPAFEPDISEGYGPLDVQLINQSMFSNTYRWTFSDGATSTEENPFHTFEFTGQYTISLVADNGLGCPDSITYSFITVWEPAIFVPNAFTPNGDGINDYFTIPNFGWQNFQVRIYDRWGILIYLSNDPQFQWDGQFKGLDAQEGVFTFVLEARNRENTNIKRAGTVTLIR